ncbi:uncharacterized protein [Blastocystis hominis]|uniref:Major facilitator superfamily (MFS) profile domain-containing protein n=1 Tax=Blastocystis hominis TaxID=12968 RepID=D8M5B4_BLAHO|nr:uncharacterized protein [Blastocystis hominis]CBK23253.2 unnamed protein product [Blastocystis hominis]|eukprot:XP_012897301.1 uncharacterized protein [Blastocystis hominis]
MPIDVEKGFHKGTLFTCVLAITAQSVMNLIILPTMPFMVKYYIPDVDISEVGYYSGFILSLYYLGQIPGCIFWGWYADQHGRKKALLIITLFNVICTSGLGISSNYYLTLVIRLIHGFADGALNVTKTMIAEISNERNLPLGTSFVFLGAALGRLLGPVLGGYLSHPENFSTLTSHFPILLSHPFLLPFGISAFMFVFVAVSLLLFSEETISEEEMTTSRECKAEMKREISGILRKGSKDYINSHEQLLLQYHKYSKYSSILKERDVLLTVLLYLLLSLCQMAFDSLFSPVLANKKIYGGFEMSSEEISLILMVASPIALVTILYSPSLRKLFTYRRTLMINALGIAFCMFIYPIESLFNQYNKTVVFTVVIVIFCIVVVSNVSYKEFRGTIMAFAWFCSCRVLRCFPFSTDGAATRTISLFIMILGLVILLAAVIIHFLTDVCDKGRGSITSTIVHSNK